MWKPVLPNMLQYSFLEKTPDREAWQATAYRAAKSWARPKWPCVHRCKIFLPGAPLPQGQLSVKVVQLLGLRGPCQHKVCRYTNCLHPKSYGPQFISVAQSCLTICDPMDCSPPCSSVHGVLQARILEWIAISFSRVSFRPRDQIQVSRNAGRFFTVWATRGAFLCLLHSVYKLCYIEIYWRITNVCVFTEVCFLCGCIMLSHVCVLEDTGR